MISVELAQAALSAEPLARALELAAWIGTGRELTGTGVLRPAAAAEACGALGIDLPPGRLRSAKDVHELQQAWEVAVAGDFVLITANRVCAARDVAALLRASRGSAPLPHELAERTLLAWVRGAGVPMGLPAEPCPLCLAVLHELSIATSPAETGDLIAAVRDANTANTANTAPPGAVADADGSYVCPDCGQAHEAPPAVTGPGGPLAGAEEYADLLRADAADHAETTVRLLVHFDAAFTGPGRTPGGTVTLTPLGRTFAASVFTSLAPSADASVADVVSGVADLPPRVAAAVAAAWASARTPAEAVRDLLDYAGRAAPGLRFAALRLARDQGSAGLPAWRELAMRPGFGAYARQWLSCLGERVNEDERDEAWLLADAMTQVSADSPPGVVPFVLASAIGQMVGEDTATVLEGLRESGHPAGAELADTVGRFLCLAGAGPDGSGPGPLGIDDLADDDVGDRGYDLPEGALLQLKITLRGVSKPPVWRRVLVPAQITLGDLHQVIVRAMGWGGGHLHSFSDGITEWAAAGVDLDVEDEDEVDAGFVLSAPGERLEYTYDFGDSWEHEVRLEKALVPGRDALASGRSVPACLAGKGACPPDDCGGAYGYADLKEVLANPRHEEHASLADWLGLSDPADFDPAAFSLAEANERLRRVPGPRRLPQLRAVRTPFACRLFVQQHPRSPQQELGVGVRRLAGISQVPVQGSLPGHRLPLDVVQFAEPGRQPARRPAES